MVKIYFGIIDECQENELECGDGTCFPRESLCNGYSDCQNGRDEANCTSPRRHLVVSKHPLFPPNIVNSRVLFLTRQIFYVRGNNLYILCN